MAIASNQLLQSLSALIDAAIEGKLRQLADAGYLTQSLDDVMRFLGGAVVRQEPIPLAALPWCNVVQPGKCHGLTRGRYRLFTQCQGNQVDGDYCKKCAKQIAENGTLTCGTVQTRMASDPMEYMTVQPFYAAMEQNGWTPDYVRQSVAFHGGTIDERNFEKATKKKSRGRPQTQTPMAGPTIDLPPVDTDEYPPPRRISVDFGSDDEQSPAAPAAPAAPRASAAPATPVAPAASASLAAAEEEEEEEEDDKPTTEQINKMNKADLTALCVKYNISTTGLTKLGEVKKAAITYLHG